MTEHGLTRRGFLRASCAAAGVVALGDVVFAGSPIWGARASANEPFTVPLRVPSVLTGDHIRLVARPARVSVLEGEKTAIESKRDVALKAIEAQVKAEDRRHTQAIRNIDAE